MAKHIRPRRFRSKRINVPADASNFTEKNMLGVLSIVEANPLLKGRSRLRDDVVTGLYVDVYRGGTITFRVDYQIDYERHHLTIGSLNKDREDYVSIEKARQRAKTVHELARHGINPQDGLHKRMWREIDKDGLNWMPSPEDHVGKRRLVPRTKAK